MNRSKSSSNAEKEAYFLTMQTTQGETLLFFQQDTKSVPRILPHLSRNPIRRHDSPPGKRRGGLYCSGPVAQAGTRCDVMGHPLESCRSVGGHESCPRFVFGTFGLRLSCHGADTLANSFWASVIVVSGGFCGSVSRSALRLLIEHTVC